MEKQNMQIDESKVVWDKEPPIDASQVKWDSSSDSEEFLGGFDYPTYFDIETFIEEEGKVLPIGQNPQKDFADIIYPFVQPFHAVGTTGAKALNEGMGVFSAHLDTIADYIEEKTGFKSGGFFEAAAKSYEDNTEYWKKKADKSGPGFLEELFGEAVGGAIPGVAEFLLNVPYAGILGAAEAEKEGKSEIGGALVESAKRGMLGLVFKAMAPLKQYLRAPAMGTVFGAQTMAQGGDKREVAKSFGTGMLYSMSSPGGRMGLNELRENIKSEINFRETKARVIEKYAKELPEKPLEPTEQAPEAPVSPEGIPISTKIEMVAPEPIVEAKGAKEDLAEARLPEKSLLEEAKKYKTVEEFVEAQEKVYHGTMAKEKILKEGLKQTISKRSIGMGGTREVESPSFFFTKDKEVAFVFARNRAEIFGGKPEVVDFSIYPKKQLDLTKNVKSKRTVDIFKDAGVDLYEYFGFRNNDLVNPRVPNNLNLTPSELWQLMDDKIIVDGLRKQGFDSALLKEGKGLGVSIAVLDKNIIKSKSQLTDIWNKAQEKPVEGKVAKATEPLADIVETPTKPEERKEPLFTEAQIKRRAKQKATKEQQLNIENAKEAKDQVHAMIRNRRGSLNLSAYETNLFVNDIEKQTTRVQREAIPFVIEDTLIPEGLKRADLEKTLAKDKVKLTAIAEQVKQHFDKGWQKIKENVPDMSAEQIENYVTHIWDIPSAKKQEVTNWFSTQNRFLKKRYIDTINEGVEKFGLTPKVLDIGDIIRIHDAVANRAIENAKFVEQLKDLKYEGVSLIERADKAPQEWIYIDHPALRRGLVIPGKGKMGEKLSPELGNLLIDMGVAIGRRISPVAFGKPVFKAGEYKGGERPEVRFQRFMSDKTIAHEIGHHLDSVLKLGQTFLDSYKTELFEINKERIKSFEGKTGKYGEEYARSKEEQIAEFFASLFTKPDKTSKVAPNATSDVLNRLKQDEVLSKLIDFDFEKQAKNLIEEQMNTMVKLPVKVHPDLARPLKVIFDSRFDHPAIQAYETTNGVLKKTNLTLSLFHHGALGETGTAIMGLAKTANIYFNPVKIYKALVKGEYDIFEREPIARDAISHGLQVGATADIPVNMIQRHLNDFARKTQNIPLANKATEFIRTFNETWDKALWNYLHDTLKIYAYESLCPKIDLKKDVTKQKQEIAQFINDTFGGQNWDALMVDPKTLQIMTWGLLSPDWTLSTVRQALSPTGIGAIHKETAGLRKKMGAQFWLKAGLYFGVGINILNYTFRKWDEEKYPQYYEGIERSFIDRTMKGNTIGHKTHLFAGRYEDGSERYIRWGKQFRELPELFFDDTGFSPISATLKKVGGKLAPVPQLMSRITTGVSPSGFRDDDIYGKKGWDRVLGIGKSLIKSPLPFSSRTLFQDNKEFHVTDIMMPSSKGMTRYKAIELFKYAIKNQDEDFLKETYQFTLMNNLPAYTLFKAGLTSLKAESTKEYNEGIETLTQAIEKLSETENIADLERAKRTIKRIQKEQLDRKIGIDLLDKAIFEMKLSEIMESNND
jgi:hypothetical protein